jgi:antitoxin ParD1/3/4
MATMNISLPSKLKEWVEARVATGRFANASDYVRDLVRQDEDRERQRLEAIAELQAAVDEGLASGISGKSWDELMAEIRAEADAEESARDGVPANAKS